MTDGNDPSSWKIDLDVHLRYSPSSRQWERVSCSAYLAYARHCLAHYCLSPCQSIIPSLSLFFFIILAMVFFFTFFHWEQSEEGHRDCLSTLSTNDFLFSMSSLIFVFWQRTLWKKAKKTIRTAFFFSRPLQWRTSPPLSFAFSSSLLMSNGND